MTELQAQGSPIPDAGSASDDEAIHIYTARSKLIVLAIPAFLILAMGLQRMYSTGSIGIGSAGLVVLGGMMGFVLMQWAFDTRPILTIDADGITCRRPSIGHIPWRAVAGLGMGRRFFVRSSLLIGVNDAELDQETIKRLNRQSGLSIFLNPSVARFRGAIKDARTVQIPITYLAVTPAKLQHILEDKVQFEG